MNKGIQSLIKLFNTASRSIEPFVPLAEGKVSLYACGPTVYSYAHIGNMRTYVFEDVLRRTLEAKGYDVQHVMNITDVGHLQSDADTGEDKMSLAAKREQKSPWDIAKYYEGAFFRHSEMLGIKRPTIVCRATEHIQEMIDMVSILLDKGYAYNSGGNVYFDVSKFPQYADFASLKLEQQKSTDRAEHDDRKRNQQDFALWFSQSKFPNQIMKWDSPWGVGFPGWHIECSAMARKYLGDRIDIHCGGIDHIPVHHTNEIAQSECCIDHKWVNVWMHGAFLTVDAGKMSKSKGATLTMDTLAKDGYHPLAYRYLLLGTHYRGELKFSYNALSSAATAYASLFEKVQEWLLETENSKSEKTDLSAAATNYSSSFWNAMSNDLHSPTALSVLWTTVKADDITSLEKLELVREFDNVLGLGLFSVLRNDLSADEKEILESRNSARAEKNWTESDRLRDELLQKGIQIRDTKEGTQWVRIIAPRNEI